MKKFRKNMNPFSFNNFVRWLLHTYIKCCGVASIIIVMFMPKSEVEVKLNTFLSISVFLFNFLLLFEMVYEFTGMSNDWRKSDITTGSLEPISTAVLFDKEKEKERFMRICEHEAAHAFVSYYFHLPIKEVVVGLNAGYNTIDNYQLGNQISQHEHLIVVTYAGPAIEKILYGGLSYASFVNQDGDSQLSLRLIETVLHESLLLNDDAAYIDWDMSIQKKSREYFLEAMQIVQDNLEDIKKLANILFEKEKLTQKEIEEILQ